MDADIPKNRLVVFTGVSGSGKSSLAVDTLYAEGNRRYVESLSTYARQFLGQMERPRYDTIRGLSPSIAIQQRAPTRNPRSTVGTITEVYDYLRLLFARLGRPHCPRCGRPVTRHTPQEMVREIRGLPAGSRFLLLAPLAEGTAEDVSRGMAEARRQGLVRVRLDGRVAALDEDPEPQGERPHRLEAVVDRLALKEGMEDRFTDSVETALKIGEGALILAPEGGEDRILSESLACPGCRIRMPDLTPASFSFNSPHGACPACTGLGVVHQVDPELVVPDPARSLRQGAVAVQRAGAETARHRSFQRAMTAFAEASGIDPDVPFERLEEAQVRLLLEGPGEGAAARGGFEGVIPFLNRRLESTRSESMRKFYSHFFREKRCPACDGARLREESRHVRVGGRTIVEAVRLTIDEARAFFDGLRFEGASARVAEDVLREIRARLRFLQDVGVAYLTLDRRGSTLSGGEAQRIRLAGQLGSELTGVLYILDEPSIGLHPRDVGRLISTLREMRDVGNTVLVVEHDAEMIRASDWVLDFGPGAGVRGGRLMYSGPPAEIGACAASLTGDYLSGRARIPVPAKRRPPENGFLVLRGVSRNNLRNFDVRFPLGLFTCVTGVSGAGKSTLVNQVLVPAVARALGRRTSARPPGLRRMDGVRNFDKVIAIDQRPIGRSPRSNPVIYTRTFAHIRDLYAGLREAKMYGYGPSRFSFNVRGGRCESCQGDGIKRIEMHFLPDVYVPCEACGGKRFNEATCKVRFRGLSIADVLDLTVNEALDLFGAMPRIRRPLEALRDVGIGYVKLGQSASTLSGGESQRVKLARELAREDGGKTLYVLDEPTTGLHADDIRCLLDVLARLVNEGNTVIVIEHNLEVVKCADHVIDLGPEGGEEGGMILCEGTPEEIGGCAESHTGRYLAMILKG
ncbi:MAG: excinuclease ABC subunit UvrA [Planctomycetes bacterium]|nr:excinuclease ABC subunit UvrA [Planctomycetota bacterium]